MARGGVYSAELHAVCRTCFAQDVSSRVGQTSVLQHERHGQARGVGWERHVGWEQPVVRARVCTSVGFCHVFGQSHTVGWRVVMRAHPLSESLCLLNLLDQRIKGSATVRSSATVGEHAVLGERAADAADATVLVCERRLQKHACGQPLRVAARNEPATVGRLAVELRCAP